MSTNNRSKVSSKIQNEVKPMKSLKQPSKDHSKSIEINKASISPLRKPDNSKKFFKSTSNQNKLKTKDKILKKRKFNEITEESQEDSVESARIIEKIKDMYYEHFKESIKQKSNSKLRLSSNDKNDISKVFLSLIDEYFNCKDISSPIGLNSVASKIMKEQKFWILFSECYKNQYKFNDLIQFFNHSFNHLSCFDLIIPYYQNLMKKSNFGDDIARYYKMKYMKNFDEITLKFDEKVLQILDTNFFSCGSLQDKRTKMIDEIHSKEVSEKIINDEKLSETKKKESLIPTKLSQIDTDVHDKFEDFVKFCNKENEEKFSNEINNEGVLSKEIEIQYLNPVNKDQINEEKANKGKVVYIEDNDCKNISFSNPNQIFDDDKKNQNNDLITKINDNITKIPKEEENYEDLLEKYKILVNQDNHIKNIEEPEKNQDENKKFLDYQIQSEISNNCEEKIPHESISLEKNQVNQLSFTHQYSEEIESKVQENQGNDKLEYVSNVPYNHEELHENEIFNNKNDNIPIINFNEKESNEKVQNEIKINENISFSPQSKIICNEINSNSKKSIENEIIPNETNNNSEKINENEIIPNREENNQMIIDPQDETIEKKQELSNKLSESIYCSPKNTLDSNSEIGDNKVPRNSNIIINTPEIACYNHESKERIFTFKRLSHEKYAIPQSILNTEKSSNEEKERHNNTFASGFKGEECRDYENINQKMIQNVINNLTKGNQYESNLLSQEKSSCSLKSKAIFGSEINNSEFKENHDINKFNNEYHDIRKNDENEVIQINYDSTKKQKNSIPKSDIENVFELDINSNTFST